MRRRAEVAVASELAAGTEAVWISTIFSRAGSGAAGCCLEGTG
jgi:hypothetical protein